MTELLTAAQMRAIEQAAIASGQVTGLELMERAGQGVVEAVFAEWPELRAGSFRAVVLCGPGNNGGDGFVVARLLQGWGWEVAVYFAGAADRLSPDARRNHDLWQASGAVLPLSDLTWETMRASDLAVDALFGIGLTRDIAPGIWGSLAMAQEAGLRLVAVDILSGICADSGRVRAEMGFVEQPADLTVTFQCLKPGHVLGPGGALSGRLRVVDLGLARPLDDLLRGPDAAGVVELCAPSGLRLDKAGLDKAGGHKFSHGHALIVSGTHGRAGAARLAARGALRIGAGLVTLASPPAAMAENAARLDAIMLREVAVGEALAGVLQDARITALCLGPGMGVGAREVGMLAVALAKQDEARSLVLDADALTLIAREPSLFAALHQECVLTPHAGEFTRLFPDIAEKLNAPATCGPAYSKVDATREAAARAGCVVLFKGADTVIADPSGRAAISAAVQDRAAPWLATAGSGDVLAGFITGLLARGFSAFDASCIAAWLHVECARSFGPGLIAEDLPEELPKLFRALGL